MNFSSHLRDLHVYDDEDNERFNALLKKQNYLKALSNTGKQGMPNDVVWLVHVPFANETYFANFFTNTPLRLDSYVFAFFCPYNGK